MTQRAANNANRFYAPCGSTLLDRSRFERADFMHDTVAVRGNDLRKYLGTNAKLAVPDVHGDVLDPGGKAGCTGFA